MLRFLLLVFSFFILEPISECTYGQQRATSIDTKVLEINDARSRTNSNLFDGDKVEKCVAARSVAQKYVELCRDVNYNGPVAVSFTADDISGVGLRCHNNPPVVLCDDGVVYYQKPWTPDSIQLS